jgi:NADPH-dependent glutamate synthase beta subunit-like oxidoreductase
MYHTFSQLVIWEGQSLIVWAISEGRERREVDNLFDGIYIYQRREMEFT